MDKIIRNDNNNIILVSAKRSLDSILKQIEEENPDWVVAIRTLYRGGKIYYYAIRHLELRELIEKNPERSNWTLERSMSMGEETSSKISRNGKTIGFPEGIKGPAAERVIDFNTFGEIISIGVKENSVEIEIPNFKTGSSDEKIYNVDLGSSRGGKLTGSPKAPLIIIGKEIPEKTPIPSDLPNVRYTTTDEGLVGSSGNEDSDFSNSPHIGVGNYHSIPDTDPIVDHPLNNNIDITLSAETNSEILVGNKAVIEFKIELTAESTPLEFSNVAFANSDIPILVSLSIEKPEIIEIIGESIFPFPPPSSGKPAKGSFKIKGNKAGESCISVRFHQGGSMLGMIPLSVEVLESSVKPIPVKGKAQAQKNSWDDGMLTLLIDRKCDNEQIHYEFTLIGSNRLGLPYKKFISESLKNKYANSDLDFIKNIYEKVTNTLINQDDKKNLQRELRGLGTILCEELFGKEFSRILWPIREKIDSVLIISWEPYIPWELVRLKDPESDEIDDRYLAEYGLIRNLEGNVPPLELPMKNWSYLGAKFPMESLQNVGTELYYFINENQESLQGLYGIVPLRIQNTLDSFYEAINKCDFDVLHISCHAVSQHETIENSRLIIGDEVPLGYSDPKLIEIDGPSVKAEAQSNFKNKKPLVFLNGCETSRMGAVLTSWGGWPKVFLDAGAGAFVGTSWSIYDKPAGKFATTFYNSLLDGKTLAESAKEARTETKKFGDASWLAFKVYGNPNARRKIS